MDVSVNGSRMVLRISYREAERKFGRVSPSWVPAGTTAGEHVKATVRNGDKPAAEKRPRST